MYIVDQHGERRQIEVGTTRRANHLIEERDKPQKLPYILHSRIGSTHRVDLTSVGRLVASFGGEQLLRFQFRPLLHLQRLPLHAILAAFTEQADRICSQLALTQLITATLLRKHVNLQSGAC